MKKEWRKLNSCIGYFHCTTMRTLNLWICLSDFWDVAFGISAFTVEAFHRSNKKKRNTLAWREFGNPSFKKVKLLFCCAQKLLLLTTAFSVDSFSARWTGVTCNINGFVFFPPSVSDDSVPAHTLTVTRSWHSQLQCSYYLVTPFSQNLATSGVNLF